MYITVVTKSADQVQQIISNFWFTENNKEQLVSTLKGLSVSERMRKLRAMPLNLANKMEIRYMWHWKCSIHACKIKLLVLY